MKPTKAILGVAGFGTRRLPISKSIEKCMLPLLNRPIIDYAVQDVIKAGVTDIYIVYSGSSLQYEQYYSDNVELTGYLRAKGKHDLADSLAPPAGVRFHYVKQDLSNGKYGTTMPLWCCREYISPDESFYLLSPDATCWRADGESECALLYETVVNSGADGGLIGVAVPEEELPHYGVISMDESGLFDNIVQNPEPGKAPSNLNNATMFLLPGACLPFVERQVAAPALSHGEYYAPDILNDMRAAGMKLAVRQSDAVWLDCGTLEYWVRSNDFLLNATT